MQMPIPFTKMHGSGNDFVVIDHREPLIPDEHVSRFARMVCRRGMGIGADGVILISDSDVADFAWRYINADGSDGEMCGNGAMVGARYAVERGIAGARCVFETMAGLVRAEVDGEQVSLHMMDARFLEEGLRFDAMPGVEWDSLIMGVPHVVGVVDNVDQIPDLEISGRTIRLAVQPAGANVNVIHPIDDHTIRMRTYERGVEAETLACGTGAVSSAISAVRRGLVQQPVTVRVSSGMDLHVQWDELGETCTHIRLTGNARMVATGEILPDALA